MPKQKKFDVFLCHNSDDKSEVIKIAEQLRVNQLEPWLDAWELQPGLLLQPELERQIENVKAAAVFIGNNGLGPWQDLEIQGFLRQFVSRGCPVIPVLLSSAPAKPKLPVFLQGHTWVDFRDIQSDPMERLVWGITGRKPILKPLPSSAPPSPAKEQDEGGKQIINIGHDGYGFTQNGDVRQTFN